jgi:hypothetical protein
MPQCLDGACAPAADVLVAGQNMPWDLIMDSSSLYWTDRAATAATGRVMKAGLSGGSSAPLAVNRSYPTQLVTDGQNVYWVEPSFGILSVPVGGGATTRLASIGPYALALWGSTLFFTSGSGGQNTFDVFSVPATGGAATQLTCCLADPFHALAVNGTDAYWSSQGTIQSAPIGPSVAQSTTLTTTMTGGAIDGVIDGANLYWVASDAAIGSVPLSGGTATIVASGIPGANTHDSFLVVNSGFIYWTDSLNPGVVRKVSVTGGKVTTIANRQDTPAGIAVDSQYVYWVNYNAAGAVMRAPR